MEEEVVGKIYDRRIDARLMVYMWPYRRYVVISLAFLAINSVLQIAGPLLMKMAIDRYLVPVEKRSEHLILALVRPVDRPGPDLALYFLVIVGVLAFEFGQSYFMQWTGQNAMFDLRRQIMAHLQKLDVQFFDRNPVGRLVTRVTTDIDVLNDLFSFGPGHHPRRPSGAIFCGPGDVPAEPGLTLIMLAVLPFVILVTALFRRSCLHSYRRIRVAIAKINAYLQEHINGITVLQLFNREEKSTEEFEKINREHMDGLQGFHFGLRLVLSDRRVSQHACALAAMLAWGGLRIVSGALTLGILVAFFQYGMRFFRPIQDLSEKYNILQSAMAASERIFKLLDTQADDRQPAGRSPRCRSAAASNSTRSGSPTTARNGCCRTSASRLSPARPSPLSAIPAPARPR